MDDEVLDGLSESTYSDDYFDGYMNSDTDSECGGLKIEFKDDNVAEAVENNHTATNFVSGSFKVILKLFFLRSINV